MRLGEVSRVIRSKNAGPYMLTFDIFFRDREMFDKVEAARCFTVESAARAFNVPPQEILGFKYYRFANAIKFSIRRQIASGGIGDSDVYGAQQHAPLLDLQAY